MTAVVLWTSSLTLARGVKPFVPSYPKDISKVEVYLHTVGRGEQLYMTGGHTLLRVVDPSHNLDAIFNWGVFNFEEQGFIYKFLRGDIRYRLLVYPYTHHLQVYNREKRNLVEQKIHLTIRQKETFFRSLIFASQPERVTFRYHYYFANCSTKALDQIDNALSGKLRLELAAIRTKGTLRDAVRESFNYFPTVSTLLEIVMNGDLDVKQLTVEEDSFLPLRMQKWLELVPQFDDELKPLEGQGLLGPRVPLLSFAEPDPVGYQTGFVVSVILGPLIVGLFLIARKASSLRLKQLSAKALRWTEFTWWSFSGAMGLIMLALWTLSSHEHGSRNANLLLFWPTDLVFGWLLLRGKLGAPSVRRYLRAHLMVYALGWLLFVFGLIEQDISRVFAEFGALMVLISIIGYQNYSGSNTIFGSFVPSLDTKLV